MTHNSQELGTIPDVAAFLAEARRVALRVARELRSTTDVNLAEALVLHVVESAGGGVAIRPLAEELQAPQNTISEVVDRLDQKGYVERVRRKAPDHRTVTVVLTAAGRAQLRVVRDACARALPLEILARPPTAVRERDAKS